MRRTPGTGLSLARAATVALAAALALAAAIPAVASDTSTPGASQASPRSENRVYAGAPPRIPHPLSHDETDDCRGCHVREDYGPRLPHAVFPVPCRTCHVPFVPRAREESFRGLREPLPSEVRRARPGSPPMIPHSTQMRSNCLACHGPNGSRGVTRSSHPERPACRTCHVPAQGMATPQE